MFRIFPFQRAETLASFGEPPEYVELERRFIPLTSAEQRESAALSSYVFDFPHLHESLGWPELLERRIVVILGEGGSGKSYELRHCCATLRNNRRFSFLLELERLVDEPLADVLSPEDRREFERWQRGNRECIFLLDSVDESKLRRQSDFHRALTRLRDGIGPAGLERAQFIISSRVSEWRHEVDRQEVESRLGRRPPREAVTSGTALDSNADGRDGLLIVQLRRLDSTQVKKLASAMALADVDAFVKALDDRFAWDFAGRPLDVQALVAYWMQYGQLGSLSEIIEFDLGQKLREWSSRSQNDPLTEQKTRYGAEALAAATLLCRQQQIAVPDDAGRSREVDGIRAAECLPNDWKENEIAALLARPVFDSASYGMIRFHHRRIGEYLAAQWFAARFRAGCPTRAVEQVFFETVAGERVLRPSLTPVAAWLCAGSEHWNQRFREWVLEAAPEIHLEYGDASSLPVVYRRAILLAWVKRNEGRQRVWVRSSPEALHRLGVAALAGDVSRLILDKSIASDVRQELMTLVRFARITDCLPALQAVIEDDGEPSDLKRYAMFAVRDIATPEIRQAVWETVQRWPDVSAGLCGDAVEALFPDAIGPSEVVQLAARATDDSHELRSLAWKLGRFVEAHCSPIEAQQLLEALLAAADQLKTDWWESWLSPLLRRCLDTPTLSPHDSSVAAAALQRLGKGRARRYRDGDEVEGLDAITRKHTGVRRALFRRLVASTDLKPTGHIWFHGFDLIHFDAEDFGWLCDDMENTEAGDTRQVALRMALQLRPWKRQSRRERLRLRQAIGADAALQAVLRDHRKRYRWNPFRRWLIAEPWFYRKERYRHQLRHWWAKRCGKWSLWRYRGRLRSGRASRWIIELCHEARHSELRWEAKCWAEMTKEYGAGVTRAVQQGCKAIWRNFCPQLPHEKPVPNQSDGRIIIGLAAIQLIAEDNTLDSMSVEDAALATRYAVNELNGFPDWLTRLAEIRPAAVGDVLNDCIAGEWLYLSDRQHGYDVLADLAWMGPPLAGLVEAKLIKLLQAGDPANADVFGHALSVLLKTGRELDALRAIALARCGTLPVDDPRFAWWAAVGLQLAAIDAIAILESRLPGCAAASDVAVRIGALLESRGRAKLPQIAAPSFLAPRALRRLIPLVYQHVRREDDLDRSGGGAYTPTNRDEAQDFRNSLYSRLVQSDSGDAIAVMKDLLTEPILASDSDWIRHSVDERRRQEADGNPWLALDVRTFSIDYETDPKTSTDLFRIVSNRLLDLKDDVEQSENSLREEVTVSSDEYVLRRWLARKLGERSRQRYTVSQESEIDAEKRPDVRVENSQTDPVSIEVKWAEKWSLAALLERLENQLAGEYLRAHNSRHGIYFLAIDGRDGERQWRMEDGKLVSFEEVERILRERAREIVATRTDVESLEICTIDFRLRSP